ncbi:hypothetical protein BGZ94_005989 [Podila epigama]|nr:hypothetical protein BGZ94_005989 [Podila epigama]
MEDNRNRSSSGHSSPLRSSVKADHLKSGSTFWSMRNNEATGSGPQISQRVIDKSHDHYNNGTFLRSPSSTGMEGRKSRPLMRNTTVMTLHSDSEPELEEVFEDGVIIKDSEDRNDADCENEVYDSSTFIFDEQATNISFDQGNLTMDHSHFAVFETDGENKASTTTQSKRFIWRPPETSEEDHDEGLTTDDDHNTRTGPAAMFIQDSDPDSDEDEDENEDDDEDDDEDDHESGSESDNEDYDSLSDSHNPFTIKDAQGSYLLAPMGFDDEENHGGPTGMEGYVEAAERFQIFAGVNEFDESDQIGLQEHRPYQVIPKNKRKDHERIMENKRRQGKLLLVSLLDNFCLLYDQSPERSRKLFYVICKTLSNMGIIDEEYLEEMSAVRSSYQRAFRSLVLSALTSIKQEQMILESRRIMAPPSTPTENKDGSKRGMDMTSTHSSQSISDSLSSKGIVPSAFFRTPHIANTVFPTATPMMRTLSFGDMFDNDPTRYKHDFVEICKLGKGGFASVFKARNKLDGTEYAIKKIRLRGGSKVRYEKIFREIKFLARLDHKNVIRYYSSWLEHADYPVTRREMYGSNNLDSNADYDDDDDEYDDEYEDEYEDEYGDEGEDFTNTVSLCDGVSLPGRGRRKSIDYFGPHSEQHGEYLDEDLSMGVVFGEEDDDVEEKKKEADFAVDDSTDGITFGRTSKGLSNLDDAGHPFEFTGHNDPTDAPTINQLGQQTGGTDMERTHSASSTLTSRDIPAASNFRPRHKHKSPSVSQEMQGKNMAWELSEVGSAAEESISDHHTHRQRSNSNAFSALSSSIEEIQRSLPNSFSSSLGSRSRYRDHDESTGLEDLQEEHQVLHPFTYPNIQLPNNSRGGLSALQGSTSSPSSGTTRASMMDIRKGSGASRMMTRDLTLFIQMQLCQTTLQDYLVYRNERPVGPWKKASRPEPVRRTSKSNRFGVLSSRMAEGVTQSAPGSPLEKASHMDLVDPAVNQHIFRAIVEGVAYIHAQDMIHRDLKPGNIFLGMPPGVEYQRFQQQQQQQQQAQEHADAASALTGTLTTRGANVLSEYGSSGHSDSSQGPQSLTKEQIQDELFMNIETMIPKIGDFGLVTDMDSGVPVEVTSSSTSSRSRTTAVGTVTYASPEQLARPNLGYDQKADIYSLGIIFFELYHPFSTLMERHAVLRTLRNGELPADFVSRWPKEAAFVLWLMAEDPRMRPTANEILEFDLIRKPKEDASLLGGLGAPGAAAGSAKDTLDRSSQGTNDVQSKTVVEERKNDLDDQLNAATAVLHGLGLTENERPSTQNKSNSPISSMSGKHLCEDCKARREAKQLRKQGGEKSRHDQSSPRSRRGDIEKSRSGKVMMGSSSEADLQRLAKESDKMKRLEQSLAAMRAENRALLDRIQELEQEKADHVCEK